MANTNNAAVQFQSRTDSPPAPAPAPATLDSFLTQALQDTKLEIELGKVAMRRSASGEIKLFAQQLLRDYCALEADLRDIAARGRRQAWLTLDAGRESELTRMAALRGPEFDVAYLSRLFATIEPIFANFKSASQFNDPSLSAVARTALVKLQELRRRAEELVAPVHAGAIAFRESRRHGTI